MKRTAAILFFLCAVAAVGQRRPRGGTPGQFDYYVLSLSWSPGFCATSAGGNNQAQCGEGRKFAFVVHGLWPQYERGWPESCSTAPPPDRQTVDSMLPIMPSTGLIRHEWSKHGTCTGLTAAQYFARIKTTFQSVKIPVDFQVPLKQITVKPSDIEAKFVAANPGMTPQSVAVLCSGNGRFLQEVRLCLDKNMKPRPCSADVKDCRSQQIIMQPVR